MDQWDAEVLGEAGTLGRKSYHEVLLVRHFCKALKNLNPWMTDKLLAEAVERMTERMSSQTLMQINEQKYQYIKDGIPVTRTKPNGETEEVKANVIDFASPEKFDNPTAKATIIITIRDTRWSDLPESYSDESINYYKDAVYNYVSQKYGMMA